MAPHREEIPEEFLSQIAHELRGSLNTILGWGEFLRASPCDDLARVRAAETIIRHARQQSWMIGDLIDTWRVAAGTLRLSLSALNIGELTRAAVNAVEPMARAKQVRIETLDQAATFERVRGDAKRITQAITSLLANAVHFAPAASVVTVAVAAAGQTIEVAIHDDGTGVSRAALPFLFDRERPPDGSRASPRRDFRLGLSLAHDIVRAHSGVLTAESTGEEGGVTYRVALPLMLRAEERGTGSGAVLRASPPTPDLAPQLRGVFVLLVDDEPDAREALTRILQHYGATVRAAASAADAMEALRSERVDVLLADIGMPGEDGYDLIRSVRGLAASAARVPAVAVTAFASEADRRRALDAGYQVHLSKPIDPSALIATVAELGRHAASVR
jgi:CheY-like chemotaxis protein